MWRDTPMTHLVQNQEKTKQAFTCVTYTRVSSKEQNKEGYSPAAQEKLLRDYAANTGCGSLTNSRTSRPRNEPGGLHSRTCWCTCDAISPAG
jgi:hypothetical protein